MTIQCADDSLNLVGYSVNVLKEFGILRNKIRVFPSVINESVVDESEKIIHVAPEVKVFQDSLDGNFHIDLCDSTRDLLDKYFEHIKMEGVNQSWKAFAIDYQSSKLELQFGLDRRYFNANYAFILVRMYKPKRRYELPAFLPMVNVFDDYITYSNKTSAKLTLEKFGTHVIQTAVIGDILYQLYVYHSEQYGIIKAAFAGNKYESAGWRQFFTPRYTLAIGRLRLLSNSPHFSNLTKYLTVPLLWFQSYESIFQLMERTDLLEKFEKLPGEAIIGLHMTEISRLVLDDDKRKWFSNILHNLLRLYEFNA